MEGSPGRRANESVGGLSRSRTEVCSQLAEWEVARQVEACTGVDEPRVAGCGCGSSEHWQQSKSGLRVGRKVQNV